MALGSILGGGWSCCEDYKGCKRLMGKIVKVFFGVPNKGSMPCEGYDDRLRLMMHLGVLEALSANGLEEYAGIKYDIPEGTEFQFSCDTVGEVFPAYAREMLATVAVDNEFDYLFMVDTDMLTPINLFERLYKHNVDIVAPLAFTRNVPHKPVIYNLNEGYEQVTKQYYYTNFVVDRYPKDQLVRCDAVGFGAVLIKVDVLRALKTPRFMVTSGAGEDIHFCHVAGKAGFKVFVDTATKLTHLGFPKHIDENVYENESQVVEDRGEKGNIEKYLGPYNTPFCGPKREKNIK